MKHETLGPGGLGQVIFDAVAAKRVVKTGYVRQPGGIYPVQCDTVAGHSHAVTVIALTLAHEIADALLEACGVALNIEDVAVMAIFHDYGEAKSGDTGAVSVAVYGHCKLYGLERDGLQASVEGFRIEARTMKLFDDYRKYRTAESLLVHIADNLEGFEKALHSSGRSGPILDDALRIFKEHVAIYRRRKSQDAKVGEIADFLVDRVLVPGVQVIADTYQIDVSMAELARSANEGLEVP